VDLDPNDCSPRLKKLVATKVREKAQKEGYTLQAHLSMLAKLRDEAREMGFYGPDLVNALEREKTVGKAGRLAVLLGNADLVILDELGDLPFSQSGGALLFHLLSKLCEHTIVMITTNLPLENGPASSVMRR
jgi:DNA replication protein DnaC